MEYTEIPLIYLPYGNKPNNWKIPHDIFIILSNGEHITIPEGMVFDARSTPWYLRWLLPSVNPALLAYIIHDYLYKVDYKRQELGVKKAKEFADNEMIIWSNKLYKNKFSNYLCYYAVKIFGKKVYLK